MHEPRLKDSIRHFLQVLVLAMINLCCFVSICAEQLPLKAYTVADALASNSVYHIHQDRKGFIWFATGEGLSRFDGYNFQNFDESDGLPPAAIRFITEDEKGVLWAGTFQGLARFHDLASFELGEKKEKKFISFKIAEGDALVQKVRNQVNRILFHPDGSLWCLTDYGLYKAGNPDASELKFEAIIERDTAFSSGAFRDENGSLWFGVGDELFEIRAAEIINRGSVGIPFPKNLITGITRDRQGRLLVSDIKDLFEFIPPADAEQKGEFRKIFSVKTGSRLNDFLTDPSGAIWIGTDDGLTKMSDDKVSEFRNLGSTPIKAVTALANDRNGSLWMSLFNNGVRVLENESVINVIPKREDSLGVGDVIENADGKIWAMLVNFVPAVIENNELVERKFDSPLPASPSAWFGRDEQGWSYAAQNQGLRIKSPKLRLKNGQILDVERYIDGKEARFFEDEQGILWIAKADKKIYRGTPSANGSYAFESFPVEAPFSFFGSRMISDGAGGLWLGNPLFLGRLSNGEYLPVQVSEGLPERNPRSVFRDGRGWLWIGHRNKGVSVTKEPAADNPFFTNYSKTNSPLTSNAIRSITEDEMGRMYFATDNGVNRLDLTTNEWKHFSSKTGLAGDLVFGVYKDSKNFIWASTEGGLSRIDMRLEKHRAELPPIYLTDINISGKDLSLPETGLSEVPNIELEAAKNNLTIGFVAPNFRGEDLSYQYRLEGTGDDWSKPGKERSVSFSNLSSGSYRFAVRVIDQNGLTGRTPAIFEFQILPPIWRRWWFIAGIAALLALAAYRLYRYRVARLLEIERTRTRIATDLHDDIGTNLSKISLLSEIVRMQLADDNEERSRMLQVIGETSRESVGAMSDIVWAINPKKDSLADMTRRMRQHAEEVFLEKGVNLRFNPPADGKDIKLPMETRRELYLIFKEAVTNAAKHSGCKNLEIDFDVRHHELFLCVNDDGKGFDVDHNGNGNGLHNLHARARRIDAKIEIESQNGIGTSVTVRLLQT